MNKYNASIIELKERIFYLEPTNLDMKLAELDPISRIKGCELTILMTPLFYFKEWEIDIPKNEFNDAILDYLRNGDNPAIILSDYALDRLIIETMKGSTKHPRIFIQACNEQFEGFGYYRDGSWVDGGEFSSFVDEISPSKIMVGGAFLEEEVEYLEKEWDLENHPWQESAQGGAYVDPLYLLFRDRYPTEIAEDLVLRQNQ